MNVCAMREVVKRYKKVVALDHFNFEIKEGEIVGLLGPNGSGKSTAINCLLGLLAFDEGEVEVFGRRVSPDDMDMKRRIGFVPQDLSFFAELSVIDNIRYFAGLYEQNNAKRDEMVREAIAFVGLEKYGKFAAKKLSGGLKRRLNIACGIAHRPEFVMFDEPTVAVDAQSRNFILEGIKEMNRNGSTVLYTTHYLDEAQELCDRIVIMDEGRNMASGTLEELIDLVDPTEAVHLVLSEPSETVLKMIADIPGVVDVAEDDGKAVILLTPPGHHLSTLLEELKKHEIYYSSLHSELPSLNDVFLKLTGKALRD